MNEVLSYIDNFFKGSPGPNEKQEFERRLKEDPAFAEEVAFYVATINVLRDDAKSERKERFRNFKSDETSEENTELTNVRPMRNSRRVWLYSAAASVLVLFMTGYLLLGNKSTPAEMADRYIAKEFKELRGTTMGGSEDSLQTALNLYNNKEKPNEALQLFLDIDKRDSTANSEVKKNIGIIYLKLEQYDKALEYFKQLESIKGLHYNPGLFFQAITLLKRNQSGDSDLAKKMLMQISEFDLDGSDEARKLLDKF